MVKIGSRIYMLMVVEEEPRSEHCVPAPGLNLSFESQTLDMECFESLDDAKKKISIDLSSKNPQYQVIPLRLRLGHKTTNYGHAWVKWS